MSFDTRSTSVLFIVDQYHLDELEPLSAIRLVLKRDRTGRDREDELLSWIGRIGGMLLVVYMGDHGIQASGNPSKSS